MSKINIGWVGLGNMGNPMVRNLLKNGFSVCVYNRTREKEKSLLQLGASSAESLQQLAQVSDIVITMVTDDKAVEEVYDALLNDPGPGKLLIDMSTVGVQTSIKLASNCNKKSVHFLEAKVSGSVKPAEEGQLLIMSGGDMSDYHRAQPLFSVLGKQNFYLGEVGTASAAKLSLNYFLALTMQGLSETILFAQKLNIDTKDMLMLINESACGSGVTKIKSQSILNNDFSPAFALKHLTKDLKLAEKEGLSFPLFKPLMGSFDAALETGYGDQDAISIIRFLDKMSSK